MKEHYEPYFHTLRLGQQAHVKVQEMEAVHHSSDTVLGQDHCQGKERMMGTYFAKCSAANDRQPLNVPSFICCMRRCPQWSLDYCCEL